MVEYNADKASSEIKSLVSDAQDLFNAATTASADKAAALRSEGMRVLENALSSARDLQDTAMKTGKELASTADDYVHDNCTLAGRQRSLPVPADRGDTIMRNNEENAARLEDLMKLPPMTSKQHAEIMRKRIGGRHALEEARDRRQLGLDDELFPR